MERPSNTDRFVPQEVVYDEENEAWEVTFREKSAQSDTPTAASSYSIALRKEDGRVMSVQFNDSDGSSEAYTGDAIPNEVVAIKVATEIFATMQRSYTLDCFVPQEVFYDIEDEIWIVSFDNDYMPVGMRPAVGCYHIAMQKEDGKVVKMWCCE